MKISVVVPVYNVQDYIEQCIASIIGQTYGDLEVILVNDGSTDSSGDICEELKAKDSRIQVIHQKNGGVSAARNTGINEATGDLITFVDSDDWLDTGMYQMMIEPALENQELQVIMCDFSTVQNGNFTNITSELREGFYPKNDIIRDIYPTLLVTENFGRIPIVSACNCLYKRNLLVTNEIKFEVSLRYSEDYLFMAQVMIQCDSFFYLKGQYYYYYRQYDESRSKKYQPEWWLSLVSLNEKLKNLLAGSEVYDFTQQLKLQLLHSVLFVSNSLINQKLGDADKVKLLNSIFSEPSLKSAFSDLNFNRQSMSLRIVLFLIKHRMPLAYLIYINAHSKIKTLTEPK